MNLLFNELNISTMTKQAIEQLGLFETTSIQHHAIPVLLAGKDMIGQAQTGTGKTFAFAIPILEKIDVNQASIQALVVCPTRELALQVYKEILKLVKFNPEVKVASIYGGESYTKQFRALEKHPHIIVATPGRAIDHLERKTIDLTQLKMLILDEADEMLKMGFQEDLEKLLKDTPKTRQTALFSATIPAFIKKVASQYQHDPEMIQIKAPTLTVEKIEQIAYHVRKQDRDMLLIRVLDFYAPESAIIFANTKSDVDELTRFLQKHHYEADALHGDFKQSHRDDVMQRFRSKRLKFLIATDVAARGLDIPHVEMIINYELPFEDEVYVHRIGRTARAGRKGLSISLVYPSMRNKQFTIERLIKTQLKTLPYPTDEAILKKQHERIINAIEKQIIDNDQMHDIYMNALLEKGYTYENIASALLANRVPEQKTYEPIETPASKRQVSTDFKKTDKRFDKKPDIRSDKKLDKKPESNKNKTLYALVKINLGQNDGFKPVHMLDFFKKHADLFPKNIGDIEVGLEETVFEIHKAAVKRLDSIKDKMYKGKLVKTQIIRYNQ